MGRKLLFMCIVCAAMMTSAFGQAVDSVNCTEPIINKTDWTVSASCVGIVYGEASEGDCYWIMYQHNTTRLIKRITSPGQTQRLSERRFLWNCFLHYQLECYNESYSVSIQFYTGASLQMPAFSIECPTTDPPALDVSCPTYIKEGDPLDCTCRVSNNPQPCPVLSWDDTNDTRTVCGGETQHFHLDHVQRAQQGQQHVCKAKWLKETITKNYTLRVAYGPDNVTIVEIDKKNEAIFVRCTSSVSVPSASFAWNVSCINTTTTASSSECWLKLGRENEGKVVQCTVHNNVAKVSRSVTYAPDNYTFDTDTPETTDPVVTCTEPELDMTAWTVSAYCTGIMRGNASQDNCYWNLYKDKRSWMILTFISHQVKQVSKETFLWNCSLHHQLPYYNTTYEVYIQFRSQTNVEKHALAFSFRYVPPSLELSCPGHVNEGDPLNCTCRVSNKPVPCPQVSWDDSALSQQVCAGETTHLSFDSVQRAQNGQHHACHARWLNLTISRSYQVTVAYGPGEVTASRKDLAMARRSSPVLLKCVASDFFPAVRFTWNVTCVNITTTDNSSECLLQLTQEDDGKTFRCNVSNVISGVSQHGDYTFNMKVGEALDFLQDRQKRDGDAQTLYITAGTTSGDAVIVILFSVAAVLVVRRKTKCEEPSPLPDERLIREVQNKERQPVQCDRSVDQ